jgi:hypothetical protein
MVVMRNNWIQTSLVALVIGGSAMAQDQAPVQPSPDQTPAQTQAPYSSGGWKRFGDGQNSTASQAPDPNQSTAPAPAPGGGYQGGYSATIPQAAQMPAYQAPALPSTLTLPAGSWLNVRTTNPISTDHNQVGDAFTATLVEPIVVNGLVIARRGQIIQGRVATSVKAGHVSGTSKLGLELTQVTLVDGEQIALHSQMVTRDGGTSIGRDTAAIGTTMATGAAIGAIAGGGIGAGIGAGAGLVASTIGVLVTRGYPAVITPETVLTFRVLDPVTISTANAPAAFQPVGQQDQNSGTRRVVSGPVPRPGYGPGYPPPPGYAVAPYAAAPYPYAPYPYYGAPYLGFAPSVYFYGGRYYRRW